MRTAILTSKHQKTGSVMLEFVIAFPLVLVLILAVIQFAHIWTARLVVHYAAYCAARSALVCDESEWKGHDKVGPKRAAELVCAWIGLGESGTEKSIPGWTPIPGSAGVDGRTHVTVTEEPDWNVMAEVEFEFPLIVPIVGRMIGTGATAMPEDTPWFIGNAPNAKDSIWPSLTLKETVWLPKPYKTVTPTRWP